MESSLDVVFACVFRCLLSLSVVSETGAQNLRSFFGNSITEISLKIFIKQFPSVNFIEMITKTLPVSLRAK